jgi:hypothetical protein
VLNSESLTPPEENSSGGKPLSETPASPDRPDTVADTVAIREGDWKSYLQSLARCHDKSLIEHYGSTTAYKRACAMAYLGKRAQLHGGVCSTRHPHVITPHFVASLEISNRTQRYARYPWLEALMSVLAEIERIQDEISSGANVISFIQPK